MPKVITLKRLYNGIASLRDYTIEKALKKGDGITVRCNGQEMYLSPEDLKRGERGSEKIVSKFDGTSYYLVDFKWKINEQKDTYTNTKQRILGDCMLGR